MVHLYPQGTADFHKTEVGSYTCENSIFHCQDGKPKHTLGTMSVSSSNQSPTALNEP